MCRTGPAFSPSRASRAAVRRSSGAPSDPQASNAWLTPERRYRPWSVRTWRSSPECELAMIASSAGSRSKAAIPPASTSASSPNGLTVERRVTTPVGVAQLADDPARCVGLHDVAAMDALLDAAAELAGEDRRDDPAPPAAARRRTPRAGGGWHGGCGHDRWISGSCAVTGERLEGEDTPPIVTMDVHAHPEPPRLAASGRPAQARDPARRADGAQEVPRGRARAVVAAGLRGAGRRPRPPARDPDAARADDRRTSSASASASCRSCGPASAWSTRCSS